MTIRLAEYVWKHSDVDGASQPAAQGEARLVVSKEYVARQVQTVIAWREKWLQDKRLPLDTVLRGDLADSFLDAAQYEFHASAEQQELQERDADCGKGIQDGKHSRWSQHMQKLGGTPEMWTLLSCAGRFDVEFLEDAIARGKKEPVSMPAAAAPQPAGAPQPAESSAGAPQPAESTADASQPADSTTDSPPTTSPSSSPPRAPDGDVILKAIDGKELDEEEQWRLRLMFQEMEHRDRPWPTTGEHRFRITMAGLIKGSAIQPADSRIAVTGSRSRSRSPPPMLALALSTGQILVLTPSQFTAAYRAIKIATGEEPPATLSGFPLDEVEVYPLPSSNDPRRKPPALPWPQPPDP